MTAALEGGEWSAARPGHTLAPAETRYPFYRRLGGPQGRSGRAENLVTTGIRSRTVQPVVSRYTDWATGPTILMLLISQFPKSNVCYTLRTDWDTNPVTYKEARSCNLSKHVANTHTKTNSNVNKQLG